MYLLGILLAVIHTDRGLNLLKQLDKIANKDQSDTLLPEINKLM
jgi:hypothetical protein